MMVRLVPCGVRECRQAGSNRSRERDRDRDRDRDTTRENNGITEQHTYAMMCGIPDPFVAGYRTPTHAETRMRPTDVPIADGSCTPIP